MTKVPESISYTYKIGRDRHIIHARVITDQFESITEFLSAGCFERIETALHTRTPKDPVIAAIAKTHKFTLSFSLERTDGTYVPPVLQQAA